MINKELIINRIIKNLSKKGLEFKVEDGDLYWIYKKYYSDFYVKLIIFDDYDDSYIRYVPSSYVCRMSVKKTSVKYSYCYTKIYEDLMFAKETFDKQAHNTKLSFDIKNTYCNEIEKYYKRKYDKVKVSATQYRNINVSIRVMCSNKDYTESNNFNITYKNNRYKLESHQCNTIEEIKIDELN